MIKELNSDYCFRDDDIAIIGMAGRFSEADDIDEFWSNLVAGKESIKEFPKTRMDEMIQLFPRTPQKEFIKGGYLDRILEFEPEIFGISSDESRYLDPEHRLLLELVEEAILDSGYNPEKLSNQNVGVFLGNGNAKYTEKIAQETPMALINKVPAINAARVAYTYNFRGPVYTVGAACASSLIAIYNACQNLKLYEVDYAISGGSEIVLVPPEKKDSGDLHVISSKQKVKAFSDNADGAVQGEGGGIVLLRRLKDAVKDNDHILAVIKGGAVNSNGNWSNGIVAPSEIGQSEVILKAIENAEIDTENISYIETHGTGTKLGDPIEAAAICTALSQKGISNQKVAIGSLKPNIGHLNPTAGVASLIKLILAINQKMIPASLNFEKPNELIKFEESPIYLNNMNTEWESKSARTAGISSTGFTGSNCHLILQEYPENLQCGTEVSGNEQLIFLSARTEKSLDAMVQKLYKYIENHDNLSFNDMAFTLNSGRRNFTKKIAFIEKDADTLKLALQNYIQKRENRLEGFYHVVDSVKRNKMDFIFIYPDRNNAFENINTIYTDQPVYKKHYTEFMRKAAREGCEDNINVKYMASLYAYTKLVESYSIKPKAVLGFGLGDVVGDLVRGVASFESCIKRAVQYSDNMAQIDKRQMEKIIDRIIHSGINSFILFTMNNIQHNEFINVLQSKKHVCAIGLNWNNRDFCLKIIELIGLGLQVDWDNVYENQMLKKVQLPGYQFDRKTYFKSLKLDNANMSTDKNLENSIEETEWIGEIKDVVYEMFCAVFATDESIFDMYSYELSLDSIGVMQYIGKIKKKYNVDIPVKLFFDGNKMEEIFTEIERLIKLSSSKENEIIRQADKEYFPLSSAQQRMYIMDKISNAGVSYNIPGVLRIEGNVDKNKLEKAFLALINRHETLRTSFGLVDGDPVQFIHNNTTFQLEYNESPEDASTIINNFMRPFDLSKAPLMRGALIKLKQDSYLLAFDFHHIISDGISMRIFIKEIAMLYKEVQLSDLSIQYRDFVIWQNKMLESDDMQKQKKYWLNVYKNEIPVLDLPYDYPKSAIKNFEGDNIEIILENRLRTQLYQFAADTDTTLFMILISVLNILLAKCTGVNDIVIGIPIAGRQHSDLENIIGMFVNTLAIRSYPENSKSFINFLYETKRNALEAFENQTYQYEKLVNDIRINKDNHSDSLFNVMFAMQNMNNVKIEIDDLAFLPYDFSSKTSKIDLELEVFEGDNELIFSFVYCTKLFKKSTVEKISKDYVKLLEIVLSNKDIIIKNLSLQTNYNHLGEIIVDEVEFNF